MTPTDAGFDERIDIAVEHGLGLGGLVAGAQILDHLVWVQHVGTHLITPAGLDVAGEFLLLLGFLFVTQHQQSGLQHGHGGGAVLNLRTLVLVTTMPVGMWVMRTAEYVVFTPWPPGPEEQYVSTRISESGTSI